MSIWTKAKQNFDKFMHGRVGMDTLKNKYERDLEEAYSEGYVQGRQDVIAESQAVLDAAKNEPKTEIKKGSFY